MRLFTIMILTMLFSLQFCQKKAFAKCSGVGHDAHALSSWITSNETQSPNPLLGSSHWLLLDLGQVYALDQFRIWNYNEADSTSNGFNQFRIDYAITTDNWFIHSSPTLNEAPGTSGYQGEIVADFNALYARYILLTAIDNHGGTCYGLSEIKIDISNLINCDTFDLIASVMPPSCPGTNNGIIDISTVNGSPPFSYLWSDNSSSSLISNLSSGQYSVTVTDQQGCEEGILFNLMDPLIDESQYGAIPISDGHYYDPDDIISDGIVSYNGHVAFSAINSIQLDENFEIIPGGDFSANIEDCLLNNGTYSYETSSFMPYSNVSHIGAGNIAGVQISASDEANQTKALYAVGGSGLIFDSLGIARFLSHSTLGANVEMITEAEQMGMSAWLDWQCSLPHQDFMTAFNQVLDAVYVDPGNGIIGFPYFRMAWWQNMLTGDDYLRDRIAFHLSQLFVVSDKSDLMNLGEGLASFYDMLHDNAFGNFRDILYDVTFHPAMGLYLSHLNNPMSDTTLNQYPDENYAREVMQLFTIGLLELELDGQLKRNIYGQEIPTYSNNEVIEFAKIFTGLGFDAPMAEFGSRRFYDMKVPMIMYEDFHEPGPKYLLYGDTIPSGLTGLQDIDEAIDNLFYHPNVAPFFCRRMIQYLVTSNPSQAYLLRVVQAFEDNGSGVRGDMKAVIRAILLDPEARDCSFSIIPQYGKLVEPLLRYTQFLKAFDVFSSDSTFYSTGILFQELTFQAPLSSPSVFNFFSPNYVPSGLPPGEILKGPEFQILNSYTSLGYYNLLNTIKENNQVLQHETAIVQVDLSDELALVNDPELLLNRLDLLFTYGNMSAGTKSIITSAINQLNTDTDKLEMALYLLLTSPEYVIGR